MKHTKEKLCLLLAALCGALAGLADIVHSPYAAFVANYNGATFSNGPQVDANGGVWSYGYRTNVVDSPFYSFSGNKFKRAASALGGMNNQVGDYFIPYIVINPTSANVSDAGASPSRPITPGNEFVFQPGNANKQANVSYSGLPAIRFTAQRAGRYSVSAVCETLSSNASNDDGVTSFHLLAKERLIEERDLAHVDGGGTTYTFAKSGIILGFGETIELVVGPGIRATRNAISFSNDSASVKIEITEAEDFYSLGDDMAGNILAGNSNNPFRDGCWTAGRYVRAKDNPYPTNGVLSLLKWGFSRDTYFVGYNSDGSTDRNHVPYCCVNTNVQARSAIGASLDPHEMIVMPGLTDNADIRFVTPVDGTWRVTARVRNLQDSANSAADCGIRAFLLAGGACLADALLATPGTKVTKEITAATSRLKSGAFIDLVIDARGNTAYDPTGLKLFIEKIDDSECPYADGGVAFNTEMAKKENATNPFTDANGVTWQLGKSTGPQGAFSTLSHYLERVPGYLAGWTVSSETVVPRLQANYNSTNLVGKSDIMMPRYMLYGNELWLHPGGTTHSVLRFVAPSSGVYRANASFRDINDNLHANAGVNCYICANGQVAARGFACATWKDATKEYTTNRVAFLDATSLYLAAGEALDFSVGTTRGANSDATAMSCRVAPDGGVEADFVNVDFSSGSATVFAGRGHLGWANPHWNALRIGSGEKAERKNLKTAENGRTFASVVVSNMTALSVSTVASDCALRSDGVASTSSSDVVFFAVGGLNAGERYRLCLYGGTQGTGDARAVFSVGGDVRTAAQHWFSEGVPEVATFEATADANGEIAGTFKSDSNATVAFFGLQVAGSIPPAPPSGLSIIFR